MEEMMALCKKNSSPSISVASLCGLALPLEAFMLLMDVLARGLLKPVIQLVDTCSHSNVL